VTLTAALVFASKVSRILLGLCAVRLATRRRVSRIASRARANGAASALSRYGALDGARVAQRRALRDGNVLETVVDAYVSATR
jgi:ribosomal protein S3